jgi:hypothetical protein
MANMITESLYSPVDLEGREFVLMKDIVDHWLDRSVVPLVDAYSVGLNGWRSHKGSFFL